MGFLDRLKDRLLQKDIKKLLANSVGLTYASSGKMKHNFALFVTTLTSLAVLGYSLWRFGDFDGDGIRNSDEIKYGTNPYSKDTDNDGLSDYQEIFVYHTDPLKPNPNVKQALDLGLEKHIDIVKPLDEDGSQSPNEKAFVELMAGRKEILAIPALAEYLKKQATDGTITEEELRCSHNFSHLVKGLYDEISNFYFVVRDEYGKEQRVFIDSAEERIEITDYASRRGLELGFDGSLASNATVKGIAYYAIGARKDNLPEDMEALRLLTTATQVEKYGNNLMDFDPIVIEDAAGNTIVIESYDRARDTWMIAQLLKHRPELVEQPKKYEWINRMIQQLAWKFFDDEYGPSFFDGKTYTPTDGKVWNVILKFHDYMDELPSKMEKDDLPVFFPYWDSDLLEESLPDKVDRTIAQLVLAEIPAKTYNRDTYEVVTGIEAMELFVDRLPQMYDWIVSAWKNPDSQDYKNAMVGYRMWLQDRYVHGLENTVRQFSGEWPFEQEGTIDGFLNKNFFAWKFAKFPYAYLRGRIQVGPDARLPPNYGEWEMYAYELPLAYKSVGIPLGQMGGSGTSGQLGGPGNYSHGEYAIFGIPESVIKKLLSQKNLGRIAVAHGNGVSMMSAIDGFKKDSGYCIRSGVRRIDIYLWWEK